MYKEGSLEAPTRHPLGWQDSDFWDADSLDIETRRIYDICHGCRRCFNLCDSFPTLFDLIDESPTFELDSVSSESLEPVADKCTLCDMCYMTKCPYVPPHEFNLDFPHLMLRHKAQKHKQGKTEFVAKELVKTDRNGKIATKVSGIVNWATSSNVVRAPVETFTGIDARADLPKYCGKTFKLQAKDSPLPPNPLAPHFGKKVVFYATCFVNYNNPQIGLAARYILAKNGVDVRIEYPGCCGMPQWEQGQVEDVAQKAKTLAPQLMNYIQEGYDLVALVPSCALMIKQEWPLLWPDDPLIQQLAKNTYDLSQYIINLSQNGGLQTGILPIEGGVTVHMACHARAQNMGQKAAEMLKFIPDTDIQIIERCSGHGGTWGFMKENFEVALKIGKPVVDAALKTSSPHVVSECPLARTHIIQGLSGLKELSQFTHPIEILAYAYGYQNHA